MSEFPNVFMPSYNLVGEKETTEFWDFKRYTRIWWIFLQIFFFV